MNLPNKTLSEQSKFYIQRVAEEPNNWKLRKEAALFLYEEGAYEEAANTVWLSPEIPSTDMDIAFAVKMVSRAKPNRSIRLVFELMRKNSYKAPQMIALANVFNLIGYPMLASRCYGGALALNQELFDVGFERESLWIDDDQELEQQWIHFSEKEISYFTEKKQELDGEPIVFDLLPKEFDQDSFKKASEAASHGDATSLVPVLKKLEAAIEKGEAKPPLLVPPSESN